MCGIYGQFNFKTDKSIVQQELRDATRTLTHRGPDDEGYYVERGLGLGFRRLSIIDLSGGHQPMSDVEETVWLIFNGEIYNFIDLRAELQAKGHVFRTRSDTEVIIYAYKEWGDDFLNRLNGMFGLALWDARARRLIVARDAMGIKPVYYRVEQGSLYFASEVRALLRSAGRRIDIDAVALNLFLRYRYTPAPLTLFEGVKKLAAGTMLVVEGGNRASPSLVPLRAGAVRPAEAARRSQARAPRALRGRAQPSSHCRCTCRSAAERWHGFGAAAGVDEQVRQILAYLHRRVRHQLRGRRARGRAAHGAAVLERRTSVEMTQATFEHALAKVVSAVEEPVAASSMVPMYTSANGRVGM